MKYDPKDVPAGFGLYVSNCLFCHGVPGVDKGGNIPNLGYVDADLIAKLDDAVFSKAFAELGMPDFTGKLKPRTSKKSKRSSRAPPTRSGRSESRRKVGAVTARPS